MQNKENSPRLVWLEQLLEKELKRGRRTREVKQPLYIIYMLKEYACRLAGRSYNVYSCEDLMHFRDRHNPVCIHALGNVPKGVQLVFEVKRNVP